MSFPDLSTYITKENIIFLVILGLGALIFLVVTFFVVRAIVRFAISVFKKIFIRENENIDQGSDLSVTVEELEVSREEREKLAELEKEKTIKASPKLDYNNFPKKAETEGTQKSSKQIYEEKEQVGVEEGLARLKAINPEEDNSTGSRMPLRTEKQEDDKFKEIKIPVPKRLSKDEPGLENNKESLNNFGKVAITTDHGALQPTGNYSQIKAGDEPNHLGYGPVQSPQGKDGISTSNVAPNVNSNGSAYSKDDKSFDDKGLISEKKTAQVESKGIIGMIGKMFGAKDSKINNNLQNQQVVKDTSIFGGGGDLNRRIMKYKLKFGKGDLAQKIYKAQKASGIHLSSTERESLVTKYFPKFYGQNISKQEFAKQVKLLEKKQIMDPAKRLQTKREINFLKKIGGIK